MSFDSWAYDVWLDSGIDDFFEAVVYLEEMDRENQVFDFFNLIEGVN